MSSTRAPSFTATPARQRVRAAGASSNSPNASRCPPVGVVASVTADEVSTTAPPSSANNSRSSAPTGRLGQAASHPITSLHWPATLTRTKLGSDPAEGERHEQAEYRLFPRDLG